LFLQSSVVPAITHLHRDAGVARLAQRHEIVGTAATTFGERKDVVDLLGRRQLALLLTLLAERVRFDVTVTDTLPSTTIPFIRLRLTLEMVVMVICLSLVLRAVKSVRQLRTAGVLARSLRFSGHDVTSSWA